MMSHDGATWPDGLIQGLDLSDLNGIIASASDMAIVITTDGHVLSARGNQTLDPSGTFEGWAGAPLAKQLTVESVPKFESRLAQFLSGDGDVPPVELNHPDEGIETGFPVRYTFHQLAAKDTVLMLGRDLGPIWETQQQLVAAQVALERDYEARRDNETMFRVMMTASTEAMVFVNVRTGNISDCNPAAETLLRKDKATLSGQGLMRVLNAKDGAGEFERLVAAAARESNVPIEVKAGGSAQAMLINPIMFRLAGERVMLCRLSGTGDDATRSDELYRNLIAMFEVGIDGIVFVAKDGRILNANDAFLGQANVATVEGLKGRAIADFLGRGSVDANVMFENAGRMGAMRLYATKLLGAHGGQRQVEISTSKLRGSGDGGFVLVVRDANRVEGAGDRTGQPEDVDMASLIQLIGSQSLKDIVSKTTDAVEKMCIETAVDLTSNNRVAAAEMLGLSRQSLYVKLRKYGLL